MPFTIEEEIDHERERRRYAAVSRVAELIINNEEAIASYEEKVKKLQAENQTLRDLDFSKIEVILKYTDQKFVR